MTFVRNVSNFRSNCHSNTIRISSLMIPRLSNVTRSFSFYDRISESLCRVLVEFPRRSQNKLALNFVFYHLIYLNINTFNVCILNRKQLLNLIKFPIIVISITGFLPIDEIDCR